MWKDFLSLYLSIGIVLIYPSRENYNLKVGYYDTEKTYYIKVPTKDAIKDLYLIADNNKYYFSSSTLNKLFVEHVVRENNKPIAKKLIF